MKKICSLLLGFVFTLDMATSGYSAPVKTEKELFKKAEIEYITLDGVVEAPKVVFTPVGTAEVSFISKLKIESGVMSMSGYVSLSSSELNCRCCCTRELSDNRFTAVFQEADNAFNKYSQAAERARVKTTLLFCDRIRYLERA